MFFSSVSADIWSKKSRAFAVESSGCSNTDCLVDFQAWNDDQLCKRSDCKMYFDLREHAFSENKPCLEQKWIKDFPVDVHQRTGTTQGPYPQISEIPRMLETSTWRRGTIAGAKVQWKKEVTECYISKLQNSGWEEIMLQNRTRNQQPGFCFIKSPLFKIQITFAWQLFLKSSSFLSPCIYRNHHIANCNSIHIQQMWRPITLVSLKLLQINFSQICSI